MMHKETPAGPPPGDRVVGSGTERGDGLPEAGPFTQLVLQVVTALAEGQGRLVCAAVSLSAHGDGAHARGGGGGG